MKEEYSKIDDIIFSFLDGEITENEMHILQEWLAEDVLHKNYFRQIYKIWAATDITNENASEVEKTLEKIKFQIHNSSEETKPKRTPAKQIMLNAGKWAAVVFLSLCAGAFIYSRIIKSPSSVTNVNAYNEITVPFGSKSKIRLPDGTEVLLNAGSKLSYNLDYGKKLREVEFSGEAYFKVAKQKEKPFIVHTSQANIKALGTEFNVKAYPNENTIETILVEGSVVVNKTSVNQVNKGLNDNDAIVLKPGQKLQIIKNPLEAKQDITPKPSGKATVNNDLKPLENHPDMRIATSDVQIETSWKDKRWIIRGTSLADLAVLFSRRFNVDIQMRDSVLRKYKFSGMIENETLEEVLNIMKYTIPISCKIDKGKVTWSIDRQREKDYKEAY